MKKWRKFHLLGILFVCVVGLLGCTRTRIIDQISIVHVFGFDLEDNGDILGTALFPDYTKSKGSDEIQYLEEKVETGAQFVAKMAKYTSTPVELAKIRVLVFGKDYAEAGILDMVERLVINPQVGTNIQIAVSKQSAKETLNTFKKEKSLTLAERLKHNMQGQDLPNMNLHVFLNHFFGEGMDAYVPMLTIDDKDQVMIDGMGIFKDEKLKLQLNSEQTILFSLMEDERTQATYKIDLDEKDRRENITLKAFRSKSHWDWNQKKEQLNLRLQLQMTLTQYPDRFNVEKTEDVKEMKKLVVEKLEKEMEELLASFKENEVDPLGIGNIVRSKDRSWEEKSFYEKYPTLPIQVSVNLRIIHSGLEA